jgi:eukaryotic-like serine/threonine-protein kinase
MEELVGRSLNRYDIVELVGEGGVGAVFRAHDTTLQRDVAIKVMRPEFANRSNFRDRFLNEARTAARLDHPSVVKVHDFGQDDDLLYIVMELIHGNNLRAMLRNLRDQNQWVLLSEAVQIVRQISYALDYVHEQGVIHRDIKPDNLMLKPEPSNGLPYRVVITDLGLARLIQEESGFKEGVSMGTPGYISPEQALGEDSGPASEVYSLGILLYELAVGRLPFPAKTISEAIQYHTEEPIPSPRSIRPDLPIALERVILKALEKNPADRFQHTRELADALDEAMPTVHESTYTPESIEDTVSLVTQYDLDIGGAPATTGDGPGVSDASRRQDYIQVLLPDRTVRMVQIISNEMYVGREPSTDLVLEHPKISRQHVRIQYKDGQYWITDLNSRNGSFLGDARMNPGEPVVWQADQALRIGEVLLRLKRGLQAGVATAAVSETQAADTLVDQPAISSPSSSRRVAVYMETVHISVLPGSSVTARFVVINRGSVMDQFRIRVDGIPPGWITPPPVLQLPPGGQQEVRVDIQPPQSPQSRPGRYPITIHVISQDDPDQTAEVQATLTLGVYTRFTSELRPRRLNADQATQVTIHNQGNAQETFMIDMIDQADELSFHPNQTRLTLPEGEMGSAEFLVSPARRRWIGSARNEPFSARVTTSGGETRTHSGEMVNPGIIPPIVIPFVLILCLCLSALGAYGFFDLLAMPARAQQTAIAETQNAAATQAALALANQATIQAATATAEWFLMETLTAMPTPETPTETPAIETPTPEPTPTETLTPIIIVVTPTPQPESPTPIVVIPTPIVEQPTPTPLGGSILIEFASNRDGHYEIYAMLSDGTRQTRLTNNPNNDTSPSLSPDSSRVVFVSDRDGNRQIYMMNADGTGLVRLTNNAFEDYSPSWSPNGTRIAFVSTRDGNPEIYSMNIDGSNQIRLTNNPGAADENPNWSPDNARIVFDSGTDTNRAIFMMNADGSGRVPVTTDTEVNMDPAFSPDGARIAFSSNRDGNFEIYLMNADGSGVTRITNMPEPAFGPDWSRDGQWIAFYTRQETLGNIYQIRPDGSNLVNLTANSVFDIEPSW